MIRLNPQQLPNKSVTGNLFPPEDDFFTQLFASNYRVFLETNATTVEGMQYVARHYGVEAEWKSCLNESSRDNRAKDYNKLLHIFKTLSNQDYVWISFVEGLHRHATIVMCLTCSTFDLEDNNIVWDSLKKKDFKLAGVPHYKNPQMSPIQVLNSILNGDFDAPMLMNPFPVQVLLPSHKKLKIENLMNTLKESSMWISTNKKLSAEKPISKRLANELTKIMEFSTPLQRNKYRHIPEKQFKYQSDVEKSKFEKLCSKQGEQYYAQYPDLLASDEYTNCIKDPFNKDKTSTYLTMSSPH
jgi:hypothetical protein